jgi:hypothetical protein
MTQNQHRRAIDDYGRWTFSNSIISYSAGFYGVELSTIHLTSIIASGVRV